MIKIIPQDNQTIIYAAVTDFSDSLGYCEYKVPIFIKGIKAPPTLATIESAQAHKEEEEYEKEHVEFVELTPQQLVNPKQNIEFLREDIFTRLLYPLKLSKQNVLVSLFGRTDKIKRFDQTLVVQDDKFTANPQRYDNRKEPYPDQLLQVLTYLNSTYSNTGGNDPNDWFDIPHKQKQWILRICDKNTKKPYKTFNQIQDPFQLQFLHSNIERFASIALEIQEPKHHNIPAKCDPCRFKNDCEFAL